MRWVKLILQTCIPDEEYKKLQLLLDYYNTRLDDLLVAYIKWMDKGNLPKGYEIYGNHAFRV